jgi:hypothetical protein
VLSLLSGSGDDNVASDHYPGSIKHIIDDLATVRDIKVEMIKFATLKGERYRLHFTKFVFLHQLVHKN